MSLPIRLLVLPVIILLLLALSAAMPIPSTPAIAWRNDFESARQDALRVHRPLLVVLHCALKPDESGLDTRDEKPVDPVISRLIGSRFVPVRISTFKGVDLALFRFDYDLQFVVLVIDPRDRVTLARWGTHDGGDDSGSARGSVAGLAYALTHAAEAYVKRSPGVTTQLEIPVTLADIPGFAATRRAAETCYHCHYAYDARIAADRAAGLFTSASLFRYPLPETVGLTLNRDQGREVHAVQAGSPAAKAGLLPGQIILSANGTPVYSSADLQFALDSVSAPGHVTLLCTKENGKQATKTLDLRLGWRESEDISWRASQGGVPPFLGTWEKPLTAADKIALGIGQDRLALRINFLFAGAKWAPTYSGLLLSDVIAGAEGEAPPPAMSARQFHTWFRLRYAVGETAHLVVFRNGKRIVVPILCRDVDWQ